MSGGGALGLGKQKTDSQSTTDSFGISSSMSQDMSSSYGTSVGGSVNSSNQNIAFEDLYKQLYGGASSAAGAAAASAPEIASAARQLFTGGANFLQELDADPGTAYLTNRLSADNPVLQTQVDALRQDTGRLFTENLNPAITSRAVAGGTLGGGRQGVAQGLAMESAAREFERGATALRGGDISARDAAAMAVASNSVSAASTGLGSLPGLLDLVSTGAEAPLASYSALSSIMGGPTTLSTSQGSSFSNATQQSVANAFARSSGQQGTISQSTTRGRGWNFSASGYGGVG